MARVIFFAFDIAEAAQLRRIDSIRALGHSVASVSFRRRNMAGQAELDWPDLPLGVSSNNRYLLRIARLARAVLRLWRHRRALQGSDVWIARNLDMLFLAVLMRWLTRADQVRVVYECLDIHALFTRKDAIGAFMRWAERCLLDRCALLILSSPGFLNAYFKPVHNLSCPVAMLENKLWVGDRSLPRPTSPPARATGTPFKLGWVGSLRCARSLGILAETARRLEGRVQILCHGAVHHHAIPDFEQIVASAPNIEVHGAYQYPDDLASIYASCDAVWAQDLWQSGANSDWLLPNRIYEASYFGCPSIALAGTQTGRRVQDDALGFVVDASSADALIRLLETLDVDTLTAASSALLARPAADFRLTKAELAKALAPVFDAANEGRVAAVANGRLLTG